MTAKLKEISAGSIVTSLVMTVCTFVIVRFVGSVGDQVAATNESMIKQIVKQEVIEKAVTKIEGSMMTRDNMTVEFLKLQKADKK